MCLGALEKGWNVALMGISCPLNPAFSLCHQLPCKIPLAAVQTHQGLCHAKMCTGFSVQMLTIMTMLIKCGKKMKCFKQRLARCPLYHPRHQYGQGTNIH